MPALGWLRSPSSHTPGLLELHYLASPSDAQAASRVCPLAVPTPGSCSGFTPSIDVTSSSTSQLSFWGYDTPCLSPQLEPWGGPTFNPSGLAGTVPRTPTLTAPRRNSGTSC